MPRRRSSPAKWTMFPSQHANVSLLLEPSNLEFTFHTLDTDNESIQTYDTNIMGSFRCNNSKCVAEGWSSKQIAITIRLFPNQQYNARVYYQRCKACNRLSEPRVDGSYAERVVYRLKKWMGVEQEARPFGGESKGPHVERLCEGCKAGHCGKSGNQVDGLAERLGGFVFGELL